MKTLKKIFKTIIGILLLPFCVGAIIALYKTLIEGGSPGMISLVILFGILVWVLIYIFLPKANVIYVFGHEMTHVIANWLFGGKLKKIKVSSDGGHVIITKSNFLTSLAPYFLPIYALLFIAIFAIGNFFWNWSSYSPLFYFLIGVAYAFHITMTFDTLKTKQPDIVEETYIFSGAIILLGNTLILLIGIALLNPAIKFVSALALWPQYSAQIYEYIIKLL